MLECEKYERDRHEMMQVILSEFGHNRNERVEKTGREWLVLLLGLCRETRAADPKGLALERSRATCIIKIKIKIKQDVNKRVVSATLQPLGQAALLGEPRNI
ncbi:hypothetical protein E2C01_060825 [Portunus trituberculatus]|uniref:Uncharacterized protein n=1 Tax=Portunus trituberculatus TaxID=210409 RepID=A0A5B7HDF0_PORTR|nr:hypothetical protein [Portunus trituberculatus]